MLLGAAVRADIAEAVAALCRLGHVGSPARRFAARAIASTIC
jgi:hypothetical protein